MEKKKRREEKNKEVNKLTLPITVSNGTDRQPNMNMYPLMQKLRGNVEKKWSW